jgi:hypothetical protein
MSNQEMHQYFCSDKTDWYSIDNGGRKIWDAEKVNEFWERIRLNKMERRDYNFDNFVFPKFQMNGYNSKSRKSTFRWDFWDKGQIMEFDGDASFVGAKFLDAALFMANKFKNVKFIQTRFEDRAGFNHIYCQGMVQFGHLTFSNTVSFLGSEFSGISASFSSVVFEGVADFRQIYFNSRLRFINNRFNARSLFNDAAFNADCEFKHNDGSKTIDFSRVRFFNKALFDGNHFSSFKLESINKSEFNISERTFPAKPAHVNFIDTMFNERCVISNTDLIGFTFINCDISNLSFTRCDWQIKNNRLFTNETGIDLKNLEEHYRQLKRNFDSRKNWEMSGFAYVAEMELRQKRLFSEKKYYYWFVHWFYGFFSRYTQDIKRPVVSFIALILVSSGIFFFMDCSYINALQRGVAGALPYMQIEIDKPFDGNWLILRNIEFLLGSTFLAFFILALRKRFKQ